MTARKSSRRTTATTASNEGQLVPFVVHGDEHHGHDQILNKSSGETRSSHVRLKIGWDRSHDEWHEMLGEVHTRSSRRRP